MIKKVAILDHISGNIRILDFDSTKYENAEEFVNSELAVLRDIMVDNISYMELSHGFKIQFN